MKASAAELGGERGPCCSSDPARSSSNPRLAEPPPRSSPSLPLSQGPASIHQLVSWPPCMHRPGSGPEAPSPWAQPGQAAWALLSSLGEFMPFHHQSVCQGCWTPHVLLSVCLGLSTGPPGH